MSGPALVLVVCAAVLHATWNAIVQDGRALHVRAERGAAALPAVLSALEAAGLGAATATIARPSLDDVYLRYAGRAFGAAESEGIQ